MNKTEVNELIEKAIYSLDAAELLLQDGFIDFSASRAYYAMFYSLEALLLNQNRSFSKHSGIISAFGKDFVKTGLFDKKFHQYVLEAFDLRNAGDYGAMHAVPEKKANGLLAKTKELIDAVQAHLESYKKGS